MRLTFTAPNLPLSENESRRFRHWAQRARRLDPWKEAASWAWSLLSAKEKKTVVGHKCSVTVFLPFGRPARRDPHNYIGTNVKAIVDGLTTQRKKIGNVEVVVFEGAWEDDTPEFVTVNEPVFVYETDQVDVLIEPVEDQ